LYITSYSISEIDVIQGTMPDTSSQSWKGAICKGHKRIHTQQLGKLAFCLLQPSVEDIVGDICNVCTHLGSLMSCCCLQVMCYMRTASPQTTAPAHALQCTLRLWVWLFVVRLFSYSTSPAKTSKTSYYH